MTAVAKRGEDGKLRWFSWDELPRVQWFKKLYLKTPNIFIEVDGLLYKKTINAETVDRLRTLINSCLKISGSNYALALALNDGNRKGAAFKKMFESLSKRIFQDKLSWVDTLETYIKNNGVKVAIISEGQTHWIEVDDEFYINASTMKTYLCTKPEKFEKVGNALFLLPTQNILLENMLFRAVELAGGEYALASILSNDKLTRERHIKNFERMCFKHDANFKTYSKLLSDFLQKTQTLFEEDGIYA